jgi:hypothetical protein
MEIGKFVREVPKHCEICMESLQKIHGERARLNRVRATSEFQKIYIRKLSSNCFGE